MIVIWVFIYPGSIELTFIFLFLKSIANDFVKPEIADLLDTYAGLSGKPTLDPMLDIFIIFPPLFLLI